MSTVVHDVAVVGGGVAGLLCATLLADRGYRVCLLEPRLERTPPLGAIGIRTLALTPAARRVLEAAGAWARLDHSRIGTFTRMEVWDAGSSGRLDFDPPPPVAGHMGYIVEQSNLTATLAAGLALRSNVTVSARRFASVTDGPPAVIVCEDGGEARARLVIGADGAASRVRAALDLPLAEGDYGQTALLCNVRCERPHGHVARQRFLPGGPVAALPLAQADEVSIVWSQDTAQAEQLAGLDEATFCRTLAHDFDGALGAVDLISERACFPLRRLRATRMVQGRTVVLGDAAHVVHPLAGQGLNLGILDVAALIECLGSAAQAGSAWPPTRALRRFERWRQSETLAMLAVTDGLNRLFRRELPVLRQVRGLGMRLTDGATPLKHWLIRHAMGDAGDVPALAAAPPRAIAPGTAGNQRS